MALAGRTKALIRRVIFEGAGWILVVGGIILMPLPGPGTLVLVSGVAILAVYYSWARRILDPLRRKAIEGARQAVSSRKRIAVSALGCLWLVFLGVVWVASPTIPEFDVWFLHVGPQLPAAGWVGAIGLFASAVAATGVLVYSVLNYRDKPAQAEAPR